ncbi:hypothetical protein SO802_003545 [Lithocarpus litseifolius]|uniref:Uncharacterized protein n=1 Tax=Lithocarpus litseifolius TaxID=425828 RepID=A0AAW2E632_9ROSI
MASTPHEKVASVCENLQVEENDYVEDYEDIGTYRYLIQQQSGEKKEDWLVNKMRQVKQFSELLGGPKWKNFIRLFSMHGINKKRRVQFQYDLQNYALNFGDGINGEVEDDAYLDFMPRYVAPPGITKGEASHEPDGF